MKLMIIIALTFISQSIFAQTAGSKPYDYKTANGKVVGIEIDTAKYKPIFLYEDFLYKLYNKETDISISINEKKNQPE